MKPTETLEVSRLRGATIIKLVVIGSVIGSILIMTLLGIIGLFGGETMQWNGEKVTGPKSVIAAPFIGAFMGLVFGLCTAIPTYLGLRFFSLFSGISIEYVPVDREKLST